MNLVPTNTLADDSSLLQKHSSDGCSRIINPETTTSPLETLEEDEWNRDKNLPQDQEIWLGLLKAIPMEMEYGMNPSPLLSETRELQETNQSHSGNTVSKDHDALNAENGIILPWLAATAVDDGGLWMNTATIKETDSLRNKDSSIMETQEDVEDLLGKLLGQDLVQEEFDILLAEDKMPESQEKEDPRKRKIQPRSSEVTKTNQSKGNPRFQQRGLQQEYLKLWEWKTKFLDTHPDWTIVLNHSGVHLMDKGENLPRDLQRVAQEIAKPAVRPKQKHKWGTRDAKERIRHCVKFITNPEETNMVKNFWSYELGQVMCHLQPKRSWTNMYRYVQHAAELANNQTAINLVHEARNIYEVFHTVGQDKLGNLTSYDPRAFRNVHGQKKRSFVALIRRLEWGHSN